MRTILSIILIFIIYSPSFAQEGDGQDFSALSLLLDRAYLENPTLKASKYRHLSALENKTAVSFLKDPVIGMSTLNRNVETKYLTVGQSVEFPMKYYYKGKAATYRAKSLKAVYELEKLKVRKRVMSLYYKLYATWKVRGLTRSNMETVKEVARVAERKYASGRGSQSESMRAHLELTNLELELMGLDEKVSTLQKRLKEVAYDKGMDDINFDYVELKRPELAQVDFDSENSLELKSAHHLLNEARMKSKLSKWNLAPDFELRYQQRISGDPEDSEIFTFGITVPLWFWKNRAEIKSASYMSKARAEMLKAEAMKTGIDVSTLKKQVDVKLKTLAVYETSLIPQALGAFNSTKSAYKANKAGFLDLLESEKLFYKIKQDYYRTMSSYVDDVTSFEVAFGRELIELDEGVVDKQTESTTKKENENEK